MRAKDYKGPSIDVAEPSLIVMAYDELNDSLGDVHHSLRSGTPQSTGVLAFNWQANSFAADLGANPHRSDALHAGQTPAIAFAQNQRDEVRDLDDLAGSLAAEPRMKQQTYVLFDAPRRGDGVRIQGDTTPTLAARMGTGGLNTPMIATSSVRRLTPLECERLQGFPGGWTDIPGNSDTQRYRQLGNAVAVPVVEWIMRRIGEES